MGVKDEFGVVDSCHKKIANTLWPLESMHITFPNEGCSSKKLYEHPTKLDARETEEPYKRGGQSIVQKIVAGCL